MRKLTLAQLEVLELVADGVPPGALSEPQKQALRLAHDKLTEGIERARTHRRNRRDKSEAAADAR